MGGERALNWHGPEVTRAWRTVVYRQRIAEKKVNVQNVVMEGDILLHAPKSSPSHETNALEFRARLNFLQLQ